VIIVIKMHSAFLDEEKQIRERENVSMIDFLYFREDKSENIL
jgi:hypothetical protein